MYTLKITFLTILLMTNIFFLNSCAGEVEKDGQCKIECGSARPAGADMRIRPLGDVTTFDAACSGTSMDMTLKFIVEQPYVNIGKAGEVIRDEDYRPVEAISILPNIIGSVIESSNTEATHKKVHTKPEFLCSDKCGVVSLDIKPMCLEESVVTVQAVSGAVAGTVVVNITGPEAR